MKYKILIAHTPVELSWGVNKNMKMEWRPVGGIAVCNTAPEGISYYQAMESDGTPEGNEAPVENNFLATQ